MEIQQLVDDFVGKLKDRMTDVIVDALTGVELSATTNGPSSKSAKHAATVGKPRRKAPKQLCPVPRCKGLAAPIFGMVCTRHKDVPKTKIRKYREARRKAKAAGK
jgi:hypothetical protein